MLHAEAARAVDAEPRDVLEFCLDLESYLELDQKIRKVYRCTRVAEGGHFDLSVRTAMRGIRGPKMSIAVHLERWKSISFRQTGDRLANSLFEIRGQILVRPLDEGTLITRTYQLNPRRPLEIPTKWLLAGWLEESVGAELDYLSNHFNPNVIEMRRNK